MTLSRTLILLVASAVLAGFAAVAAPPATAAETECWKRLLNDWYDGRIDNAYPAACYRAAIRNLPDDVDAYTQAREDINRALLAAIRASGGRLDDTDVIPGEPGGNGHVSDPDGDDDHDGIPNDEDEDSETAAAPGGGNDDGGVLGVLKPSNADEIPLPLLVLAALALLLLAAAGAGFLARWIQARRLRPATIPHRGRAGDS